MREFVGVDQEAVLCRGVGSVFRLQEGLPSVAKVVNEFGVGKGAGNVRRNQGEVSTGRGVGEYGAWPEKTGQPTEGGPGAFDGLLGSHLSQWRVVGSLLIVEDGRVEGGGLKELLHCVLS